MLTHIGDRRDVCKSIFARSDGLNTHLPIHTGDRSFICKLCDKGFAKSSDLNTHLFVNTGDRP